MAAAAGTTAQRLLVIGGNGFVGSAICRTAVARGWTVTSLSRSGKPYATAQGHAPAWVSKVTWSAGSAFELDTYRTALQGSTAIVSTLGILFESDYKDQGSVNVLRVAKRVAANLLGDRGNPLQRGGANGESTGYDKFNRDAALSVFRALVESPPSPELPVDQETPFVYISAEDIFRPFVSSRYISTKREAEKIIATEALLAERKIRPVFIRPSLIYHPMQNPLSTVPATALSLSSHIQSVLPSPLRLSSIFPPTVSASAPIPPATSSLASLLTIPPIHVDTIAEAVCQSIENPAVRGVIGVREMRQMSKYDDVFDGRS